MKREILDLEQIWTVYICLADDISLQTLSLSQSPKRSFLHFSGYLRQSTHRAASHRGYICTAVGKPASHPPPPILVPSSLTFQWQNTTEIGDQTTLNYWRVTKGYTIFLLLFFKRSVHCTRQIGLTVDSQGNRKEVAICHDLLLLSLLGGI